RALSSVCHRDRRPLARRRGSRARSGRASAARSRARTGADVAVAEDEDVVQVPVGVGEGEVRRPGEQGWVAGGGCPAVAEVAEDELLVEDLRVEVALHLDVGTEQGGED